jgi:hypothetical protein
MSIPRPRHLTAFSAATTAIAFLPLCPGFAMSRPCLFASAYYSLTSFLFIIG